jgi:hypothetical protein
MRRPILRERTLWLVALAVAASAAVGAITGAAWAQVDTTWMRTYGGAANDGFRSVIETSDGGFLAVGYTYSFGGDDANVYAVKAGADGELLWQRAYGGPGRDYGFSVCETGGGYAIAGYTTSYGAGREDAYLVRIDADGDTVWTRSIGGSGRDEGRSICEDGTGGLVLAGSTESFGSGASDMYIVRIDAAGDTVWTRTLGGAESDWAQSVCRTADGSFGVGGVTGSSTSNRDICVAKLQPGGSVAWQRYYGSAGAVDPDWGMSVCATADSGITLAGYQALEGKDPGEVVILGLAKDGTQAYYRKYAADYYQCGCGISPTHDGGFVVCGANKDPDTQKNDLMLLKRVSGSGWMWAETVGGALSDWGSSVVETQPGCFLVAGHTQSFGAGGFDGWLVKLCDAAASVTTGQGERGALELAADANPVAGRATLRFSIARAGSLTLGIYDVAGRLVALLAEGQRPAGDFEITWDGTDTRGLRVGPGIYVVRLVSGGTARTHKLVLLSR